MNRNRILAALLILAMLFTIPALGVAAASNSSTIGTGTVQSISLNTDSTTHLTTVAVTLLGSNGQAEKDQISLETAITLNLVTVSTNTALVGTTITSPVTNTSDPNYGLTGTLDTLTLASNVVTITVTDASSVVHTVTLNLSDALWWGLVTITTNSSAIGTQVVINPSDITNSTAYSKNVTTLGTFFGPTLGVTYDQLNAYLQSGVGYGVLAQALWLATDLQGSVTLQQIITAKTTGNYSGIVLPDGTTPKNWGQFLKAVLTKGQNLGNVVSGKAAPLPTATPAASTTTTTGTTNGNGNGNSGNSGNSNAGGNGNGNSGNSNAGGNGNGNSGNSNAGGNGNGKSGNSNAGGNGKGNSGNSNAGGNGKGNSGNSNAGGKGSGK